VLHWVVLCSNRGQIRQFIWKENVGGSHSGQCDSNHSVKRSPRHYQPQIRAQDITVNGKSEWVCWICCLGGDIELKYTTEPKYQKLFSDTPRNRNISANIFSFYKEKLGSALTTGSGKVAAPSTPTNASVLLGVTTPKSGLIR
jgi:hypothetical protein